MKKQILLATALTMLAFPALAAGEGSAENKVVAAPAPAATATEGTPASVVMAPADKESASHTIDLTGNNGKTVGSATVTDVGGGIFVDVGLKGVLPGWHAFHIHAVGDCSDKAAFKNSGGHLKHEGQMHGAMSGKGPHIGDMPNIWVGNDGTGKAQFFSDHVTWADLSGADGSAFVVHAGADDYKTDPAGNAGARVGCGVIVAKGSASALPPKEAAPAAAPETAPPAEAPKPHSAL
ncbi:MAG TPA: superoxide dismutase family protein [Patescibacteria group bacterium]|jgi:Cu-Zn family superoxide dismutase|nr:superoxide dismutase family protein [Patescibacteria group bacterium]